MTALLALLLLQTDASASEQALRRLQAKVPVEMVPDASLQKTAGHYSSTSQELGVRVGGFLSGQDLYLCPDGSYVYTEWADVKPVTVHDKGRWTVADGFVRLASDADVTWSPGAEREYVPVRRQDRKRSEVLLVGTARELPYFEHAATDDPGFQLLLAALVRTEQLQARACSSVKARLMRQGWRPEYFKTEAK